MSHSCPSHACPQHLYADALHSIFAFLSLGDTAAALSTCKHWHEACKTERRCRGLTLPCPTKAGLRALRHSFLRRHVSCLVSDSTRWYMRSLYGPIELASLAQLPNLTSADLCLDIPALAAHLGQRGADSAVDLFPHTLRHLAIASSSNGYMPVKQSLLQSIAQIRSLTSLSLSVLWTQDLQLAPLVALPHLRCLQTKSVEFGASNVSTLLQLSSLERLAVTTSYGDPPFIEALCSAPNAQFVSRLRHLEVTSEADAFAFTAETIRVLAAACPHLESLKPSRLHREALLELFTLTALRTLKISIFRARRYSIRRLAADLPSIILCPTLTDLTLCDYSAIAGSELRQLVEGLPGLRALSLDCSVTTLAPLRPLSHLTSLSMLRSSDFSLAKLSTLVPMPQLRSIHIELRGNKFRSARTIRKRFPDATDVLVERT